MQPRGKDQWAWNSGDAWDVVRKQRCRWAILVSVGCGLGEKEHIFICKWEFLQIFPIRMQGSWDLLWSPSQVSCLNVVAFKPFSLSLPKSCLSTKMTAGEHLVMGRRLSHFGSFDTKLAMHETWRSHTSFHGLLDGALSHCPKFPVNILFGQLDIIQPVSPSRRWSCSWLFEKVSNYCQVRIP